MNTYSKIDQKEGLDCNECQALREGYLLNVVTLNHKLYGVKWKLQTLVKFIIGTDLAAV